MKSIRNWIMSLVIIASAGGAMLTMVAPQIVTAAPATTCSDSFLGFPAWYRRLTKPFPNCDIKSPNSLNTAPADKPNNGLSNFIWRIGLNVLEIVVVAIAYLSSFYFLYGGWLFIISRGKPEGAAKARLTMTQAAIGLVVSITAVAVMNFIAGGIIKTLP